MKKLFTETEFNTAKSNDLLPCECYHCGNTFHTRKTLISHELRHNRGRIKYCNYTCLNNDKNDMKYGKLTTYNLNCSRCDVNFSIDEREKMFESDKKYFCSRSCANIRDHSESSKKKISNTLKKYNNKPLLHKQCEECSIEFITIKNKKKFCSKSCCSKFNNRKNRDILVEAGKKSAAIQSETRRSKNEIYLYELCKEKFGNVLANEPMFNGWDADVILPDLKIVILWNGIWHYKQISKRQSLKQVQYRDRIKLIEIVNHGYTPYVIKDMGAHNKPFVEMEFNNFLSYFKLD